MIKEKINNLVKIYKKDKDVLDIVYDTLNSFSEYIKIVNKMENHISIMRFRLDGEQYRETLQNIDRNRRIIHNGIISGVKILNRLCKLNKLELIYEGNELNRNDIAKFAMNITIEIFNNRQ